jgi:hypothetical protein
MYMGRRGSWAVSLGAAATWAGLVWIEIVTQDSWLFWAGAAQARYEFRFSFVPPRNNHKHPFQCLILRRNPALGNGPLLLVFWAPFQTRLSCRRRRRLHRCRPPRRAALSAPRASPPTKSPAPPSSSPVPPTNPSYPIVARACLSHTLTAPAQARCKRKAATAPPAPADCNRNVGSRDALRRRCRCLRPPPPPPPGRPRPRDRGAVAPPRWDRQVRGRRARCRPDRLGPSAPPGAPPTRGAAPFVAARQEAHAAAARRSRRVRRVS